MKWFISPPFSCSMGATRPASPSQHCYHQPRIARLVNRGLQLKSACFPTSSWLHPRVPSGCVFENSTLCALSLEHDSPFSSAYIFLFFLDKWNILTSFFITEYSSITCWTSKYALSCQEIYSTPRKHVMLLSSLGFIIVPPTLLERAPVRARWKKKCWYTL